jgi:hypothetical protein
MDIDLGTFWDQFYNDPQFEGSFNTIPSHVQTDSASCNSSSSSQTTMNLDGSGDINNMIYATGIPNHSSILQHGRGAQNSINGQGGAYRGVIPPPLSTPILLSQDIPQATFHNSDIPWSRPSLIHPRQMPEYYIPGPIGPQNVLMTDSPTSTPTSEAPVSYEM